MSRLQPRFRNCGYRARGTRNASGIATTKGLRDRATIAVLLGCALRRSALAALTDGRYSGGFTPEATVARHANTPDSDRASSRALRVLGAAGRWRVVPVARARQGRAKQG